MKRKPDTAPHQRGAGGGSPQNGGKPRRQGQPGADGKGAARQGSRNRQAGASSLSSKESGPRKQKARRGTFKPYDYEETFQQPVDPRDEERVRQLIDQQRVAVYATKRVVAGTQMDVEIYPEFTHLPAYAARRRMSPEARQNLDYRNSRKECERKINDNFGTGDLWVTLDYAPRFLPATEEEAARNLRNWVRRVNYRRKKDGLPAMRYVYVTSWTQEGRSKVRCHHHVIADGAMPAEALRALWPYGKRGKAATLEKDERGLSGLAYYLTKHAAPPTGERTHKKKWAASKNLRQPIERKNHQDFKRRTVERLAEHPAQIAAAVEAKYPAYWCEGAEALYNGVVGLFYIRANMRERPQPGDLVTISGKPGAITLPPVLAAKLAKMTAKAPRLQVVAVDYHAPGFESVTVQTPGGRERLAVDARACIIADKTGRGRCRGH